MRLIIRLRDWIAAMSMALAFGTIAGCSSTEDIVDNSSDGKGQVKISLLGIGEGSEESLTKAQAEPQTVALPVEDGFGMVCTLAADQASNTRGTTAMTLGNKYRMVAYSGSAVAGSQVYVAGDENTTDPISLLPGDYTFVFYSFNNTTSPGLPDTSGNVSVPAGTDLLWYSTTGIVAAGSINSIQVTFVRKFSAVKVVANSWGVGPTITSVSATLGFSYPVSLTALGGSLTAGTATTSAVAWSDAASQLRTSDTAPIYIGTSTGITVTFPANSVNIGGTTNSSAKAVTFTKTLVAGTRYTLNVRFIKCGAYTASGTYRGFMCHNLGADYTADPFTPSYKLNGSYWQWGNKDYSVPAPTDATGTTPSYTWVASNYNSNDAAWNSGTEAAPVKNSTYDPCPSGYRIATNTEWSGVVSNNTAARVGPWSDSDYNSAKTFGSSSGTVTLLLPAAGYAYFVGGGLYERNTGVYWSSSVMASSSNMGAYVLFMSYAAWSSVDYMAAGAVGDRPDGHSVRCIAE